MTRAKDAVAKAEIALDFAAVKWMESNHYRTTLDQDVKLVFAISAWWSARSAARRGRGKKKGRKG